MIVLPVFQRPLSCDFLEIVGKPGSVLKAGLFSNFRDGQIGGQQQFGGHGKAVAQYILMQGYAEIFHHQSVEIAWVVIESFSTFHIGDPVFVIVPNVINEGID